MANIKSKKKISNSTEKSKKKIEKNNSKSKKKTEKINNNGKSKQSRKKVLKKSSMRNNKINDKKNLSRTKRKKIKNRALLYFMMFAIIICGGCFIFIIGKTYITSWRELVKVKEQRDLKEEKKIKEQEELKQIQEKREYDNHIEELLKEKFTVSPEEIIISSNSGSDFHYTGAMYNEKIKDEYKLVYALDSRLRAPIAVDGKYYGRLDTYISESQGYSEPFFAEVDIDIELEVSIDTLNKIIANIFDNVKLDENISTKSYNSIEGVKCKNGTCQINLCLNRYNRVYHGYNTILVDKIYDKKTKNETYKVANVYVSRDLETDNHELAKAKNEASFKIITFEEYAQLDFSNYELFKDYKLNIYNFIFNKNGQLIKVEECHDDEADKEMVKIENDKDKENDIE